MPTRVLLLRHAESANPLVFHGAESDVGLSERGRRQAEAVAPLLAAFAPAVVVSSGMRRALDTAAPIARAAGLPLRVEPGLHERRVGALGGTPTQGGNGVWPDTLKRWLAGDTGFAPPGAESYDALRARLLPVWQRLTAELDGQTFAVVAHGVVCKVLLLELLPGHTVADWHRLGPIANVGIHELLRDGPPGAPWYAVRLNDVPPAA
jgi:broad specificity phosphatase PhoE